MVATTSSARSLFPAWLVFSLLTVLVWGTWGLQSKVAVDRVAASMNQVLFPIGLLPILVWALRSARNKATPGSRSRGAVYGLLTGLLGGAGNIAFYEAFERGGPASVVTPLVGLAPLVTVALAIPILHERLNPKQIAGLVLAIGSIYLLST
jgi:bacterial/archaeal transporter family protein